MKAEQRRWLENIADTWSSAYGPTTRDATKAALARLDELEGIAVAGRLASDSAADLSERCRALEAEIAALRQQRDSAREQWAQCQKKLAQVSQHLIAITGVQCGIFDNLAEVADSVAANRKRAAEIAAIEDAVAEAMGEQEWDDIPTVIRALREDKARLDWLQTAAQDFHAERRSRSPELPEFGAWYASEYGTLLMNPPDEAFIYATAREAIDAARAKEGERCS